MVPPLIVLLVGGGLGLLIKFLPASETVMPPIEEPIVNVEVVTIEPLPGLADSFVLPGTVEPNRVVRASSELAGRVECYAERREDVTWGGRSFAKGQPLREGEPISADDPILLLNKDLLEAEYARAKVQHAYNLREVKRIAKLPRGATNTSELDNATTQRDASRATLDQIQARLDRTTIHAPISGTLEQLPVEEGEYVGSGDVTAVIVDVETVKVVVDVPERDVYFLPVGATVDVLVAHGAARTLPGTITFISEIASAATRTTRVEITVDNADRGLRCGQIVRARLVRRILKDVIMVPLRAVIPLERAKAVYVARDGRAERRGVELGFIRGSKVRILSGLRAGDALIVAGQQFVAPGQAIRVVESKSVKAGPNS